MMYKYRIIIYQTLSLLFLRGEKMHCLLSQLSQDLGDRSLIFRKRSMTSLISLRPLPADRVQGGKFSLLQET